MGSTKEEKNRAWICFQPKEKKERMKQWAWDQLKEKDIRVGFSCLKNECFRLWVQLEKKEKNQGIKILSLIRRENSDANNYISSQIGRNKIKTTFGFSI